MKKIAFCIVRYGAEVNGGAEVHCRMLAERLIPYYDVEVLTTTVLSPADRSRDFQQGVSVENGVTVRRFAPQPVGGERTEYYGKHARTALRVRALLRKAGLLRLISAVHPAWKFGTQAERRYFESQAMFAPALLRHIEARHAEYDALIFLNLYSPQTALGAVIAPEKSLLIPLAHPNRQLYYSLNAPMFTRVRHIAFNTRAEQRLCGSLFGRALAPWSTLGCGIEEAPAAEWETVKARYGLPERYVLYLGRVSRAKVGKLLPDFLRYKKRYGGNVRLVLAGGFENAIKRFESPDILFTGYVSDQEKSAIVRHAAAMVNPSTLESLSLLMLEAMQNRVPLLVNGRSAVMKEHCRRSGAALWYDSSRDFGRKLHRLLTDGALCRTMTEKGPGYVRENYGWEVVIPKLRALIENF